MTADSNKEEETQVQVVVVRFKAPPCAFPAGNEEWLLGRDSNQAPPFNSANRLRHLARLDISTRSTLNAIHQLFAGYSAFGSTEVWVETHMN